MTEQRPSLRLKAEDTRPRFEDVLADNPGEDDPVDLTQLTNPSVTLYVEREDGTSVVSDTATIDDAETGKVSYAFSNAQTATTGTLYAEWVVRDDNNVVNTTPSYGYRQIEITEPLDRAQVDPASASGEITVGTVYTDELRANNNGTIALLNDLLTANSNLIYDHTNEWVPGDILEPGAGGHSVSDSGTSIMATPSDIDFNTNLSVTDDGDGTVTVDSDGGHSVSDSGTQVLAGPADVNFASNLSVTDDGDGTVTVDAQGGTADLISAPNGSVQTVELNNGESTELTVPVKDGETVTIYRWGAYVVPDGTAPAGLEVQLLNGNDTVVASENTLDTRNSAGVTTHTNSSGSTQIYKLRIENGTGSDYSGTVTNYTTVDDFEDGDLAEYSGSTADWSVQTSLVQSGSYASSTTVDYPKIYDLDMPNSPEQGTQWEWYVASSVAAPPNYHMGRMLFGVQASDTYYELRADFSGAGLEFHRWDTGTDNFVAGDSSIAFDAANTWFRVECTWDDGTLGGSAGDFTFDVYNDSDGTHKGTFSASDTTYTSGGVGWDADVDTTNSETIYLDNLRLFSQTEQGVGGVFGYEVA